MSGGPVLSADGKVYSVLTRGFGDYGIHLSPRLMQDTLTPERIAEVEALMNP